MIDIQLNLKGFVFQELLNTTGLQKLDNQFWSFLKSYNPHWHDQLLAYRHHCQSMVSEEVISPLLIDCASVLEDFLIELFDIEEAARQLQINTLGDQPIFAFRSFYILKQARRLLSKPPENLNFNELNQIIETEILSKKLNLNDKQLAVAQLGLTYLEKADINPERITEMVNWCLAAMLTETGRAETSAWEMFKLPKHLDFTHLVPIKPVPDDPYERLEGLKQRHRDGFKLTDPRMTRRQALWEVDYCVYCHKNQGDFCSRGFPVKKNQPEQGFKKNFAGDELTGCPLEEKISEMHVLKRQGLGIAALAMIMIDNPMCPATGHRICNDCMKACIYQKQEPVNIPQTETRILTDVLELPWGVEIYDLLTRWHPLRQDQWISKPYNGLKILVMGMGPAGFSLAHHLLLEGFAVAGMDGLKIEPLPEPFLSQPIHSFEQLRENLDDRVVWGFGGVAEYGITVRWDKNFLKLIYLSLSRRKYFQIIGGVRFGGTLKVEDAWALGFDHLALAVGAGLPKELQIPHSLAPGMRQANDFLMALQLTGAAKAASLANLQVRLPAVVIGGGLTAVDTATEAQAYYLVQVEKMAKHYQILSVHWGEEKLRSHFKVVDLEILDEFLGHAQEIAQERRRAGEANCSPDFIRLLRQWGGATIAYRRTMQESPAYQSNHEELALALEEGIYYAEGLEPQAVILDANGHVQALRCQGSKGEEPQALPARSIFVATGARLNIAYEFEHRGTFNRQGKFEYRRYEWVDGQLQAIDTPGHVKTPHYGPFTSYSDDLGHKVSFLGDTHPIFQGNVVKAIASAKRVYPEICRLLADKCHVGDDQEYQIFHDQISELFKAVVLSVRRHNAQVVELVVKAPMAARSGQPGQFYRIQNFESHATQLDNTLLQMEGLAALGIAHSDNPDILSFHIIEKGASSQLIQNLKPGDPLALMGPTGAQLSRLSAAGTILVIGELISVAFLLSVGEKLKSENHQIWYLASLEKSEDLYCREQLEQIADQIILCEGDILAGLEQLPDLTSVSQIWVIGSSCLLQAVRSTADSLKPLWPENTPILGSVYGPMQCMLKGVCAQCLQWQIDPMTQKRTKAVYACSWQHQPLEKIEIGNIDERLSQNHCQETLTNLWLDYIIAKKAEI